MASLLLPSISSSQFPWNPTRTRKLETRRNAAKINGCQNPPNDKKPVQIERRRLLLGMGGLYGGAAANPAFADPIPEPDVTKCDAPTDLNDKEKQKLQDYVCCPPGYPQKDIKDYELPPVGPTDKPRIRRAAHLIVDDDYIKQYEKAIKKMKALDDDDPWNFKQQAKVHCAYCNLVYNQNKDDPSSKKLQIHNSWLFFPWHRWYLYFYERILAKLVDDPTFTLPYWNWDHPDGMTIPPMFLVPGSEAATARRNPAHATADAIASLGLGTNVRPEKDCIDYENLKLMHKEMAPVTDPSTAGLQLFYGNKYIVGTDPSPAAGKVERGSHTAIHVWVGRPSDPNDPTNRNEDMGNFYSAGLDPLFYSHHTNVDRLWTIWCKLQKEAGLPTYFTEANGVTIMKEWGDAAFLFYDENRDLVRVKVSDALDNLKMGYMNEFELDPDMDKRAEQLPWLNWTSDENLDAKCIIPPAIKSRSKRSTSAPKLRTMQDFPVTLNDTVKVTLNRPAKSNKEDFLVIKDIEVDTSKFVKFEVYLNPVSDNPQILNKEYVGAYSQVPHLNAGKSRSSITLELADVLKDLGAEETEKVTVSLVPKAGGEDIKIGGIQISFLS